MNLERVVHEVLEVLYNDYLETGGTTITNISETVKGLPFDSNEVGRYLVDRGLVKNQRFGPYGFEAGISMAGIGLIHPEYIDYNRSKVISQLGQIGGSEGIMEILSFEPEHFQRAHNLAKHFEQEGIITARSTYDDVFIELTPLGHDLYNKNKASFFG